MVRAGTNLKVQIQTRFCFPPDRSLSPKSEACNHAGRHSANGTQNTPQCMGHTTLFKHTTPPMHCRTIHFYLDFV